MLVSYVYVEMAIMKPQLEEKCYHSIRDSAEWCCWGFVILIIKSESKPDKMSWVFPLKTGDHSIREMWNSCKYEMVCSLVNAAQGLQRVKFKQGRT